MAARTGVRMKRHTDILDLDADLDTDAILPCGAIGSVLDAIKGTKSFPVTTQTSNVF